ncbi:hypothetical protein CF327_g4526 [Tilletia walkeri]|nr:hypothetical protein CF327_g4526 [Tilletia walkeri]
MAPPLPEPQKKGTLVCVVLKARNLPNKRSIGKQDPYCVLSINHESQKTTPDKRGGQHPQWDQQLHFDIYEDLEELLAKEELANDAATTGTVSSSKPKSKPVKKVMKVACYADDQREPEFIGEGIVDLTSTLESGEFDEWVPLQAKDRYAGEVYLELTYYLDKAPPKKKKAPKPVVGSSTGGATGAESYGGAGVFVGEVDEDGDVPPPQPPSKHMPRPSEGSLSIGGYGGRPGGRTGGSHGNRNDRLSMTGSLSTNNLLSAPGRSPSPNPAPHAHARRQSDVPAILRPSSSMANIDMYTPAYAQQALQQQRIPSPRLPENNGSGSSQGQHQSQLHYPEPANASRPDQPGAGVGSHAGWSSQASGHQAQPSYNVVPPTPVTSYDPYLDAASEIARSMSALSFASTAHAPPQQAPTLSQPQYPQPQFPQPYPSGAAPQPAMNQMPQYAYPPPPPPPPSALGATSTYPSGPAGAPPGSMYAHTTPPTLHGHYALPPPGPSSMHGTPPPNGPQQQQQYQHLNQPVRQSSYPLSSNPASGSLAPSPVPAHQLQPHSAPTTPAGHDHTGQGQGHSPASFHALPTLPPPQQQQQQAYAPQPSGLAPMGGGVGGPQRSSSPAPSMASIASMSSFQTYSHAPPPGPGALGGYGTLNAIPPYLQQQQYSSVAAPSMYQQPPPPISAPAPPPQQQQMYGALPPSAQLPPHLQQQQQQQQPLYMQQQQQNGLPSLAGALPYAYQNGTAAAAGSYGQPPPPQQQQQGMYGGGGPPAPGQYAQPPPPPQQQQGQQQVYQQYYNYGQ